MRLGVRLRWYAITATLLGGALPARAQQVAYTGDSNGPAATAVRRQLAAAARRHGVGLIDLADPAPVASPAPARCAAGIAAYQELRLDDAERALDGCLSAVAASGGGGLSARAIADAHIVLAMVAIERGQGERSRDHLIAATTVAPAYQLDAARYRPSLIASFERARQAVARTAPAAVELALPSGCALSIDGADRTGVTAVSLPAGLHYVDARCPGHEPFAAAVTFSPGPQRYQPPLVARPPERERVLAATRADPIVWTQLRGRALTVTRLRRGEAPGAASRWRLSLETPGAAQKLDGIIDDLLAPPRKAEPITAAPVIIHRDRRRRWYERPWVWAAVGAAAGAAIVLPFALSGDGGSGFRIVPDGVPR